MEELKWSDLFAYGNIVHATVRRPGLRMPKCLSDFDLKEDARVEKSGYDGHWKIVPQEALKEIDRIGRAVRDNVDAYSVPFPLVQGGVFVPNTSIMELISKLELLKKEYDAEVDIFIASYDTLRAEQYPVIMEYIKLINPEANAVNTIQRVEACAPPKDRLKERFDVSWSVFAVQAPVNEAVAKITEKEDKKVLDTITKLVDETKKPIIKEINRLIVLISTERSSIFSMRSINFGLNACKRFETKNVFGDPKIKNSINSLRGLLETMKDERKDGTLDNIKRDLEDLLLEIQKSDTKKQAKAIAKKLGDRVL